MNVVIEHDIIVIHRCHALHVLHSNPIECPRKAPHQTLSLNGLYPKWVRYLLQSCDFPKWPFRPVYCLNQMAPMASAASGVPQ